MELLLAALSFYLEILARVLLALWLEIVGSASTSTVLRRFFCTFEVLGDYFELDCFPSRTSKEKKCTLIGVFSLSESVSVSRSLSSPSAS
jgi:hypothetical protein